MVNRVIVVSMCGLALLGSEWQPPLSMAQNVAINCSPTGYEPSTVVAGCEWLYWDVNYDDDIDVYFTQDIQKVEPSWTDLPYCECRWIPSTEPCTPCPPKIESISTTWTLSWSTTQMTSASQAVALALKNKLIGEAGFSGTLTVAQQNSLSGSASATHTAEQPFQPAMCFTKYYRKTWWERTRAGRTTRTHTYRWAQVCGPGSTSPAYGKLPPVFRSWQKGL